MTYIRSLMVCDDICICNKSYVFIPKHSHYIKYDFIMQLSTTGCIRKMVEHNYPNFCGCLNIFTTLSRNVFSSQIHHSLQKFYLHQSYSANILYTGILNFKGSPSILLHWFQRPWYWYSLFVGHALHSQTNLEVEAFYFPKLTEVPVITCQFHFDYE